MECQANGVAKLNAQDATPWDAGAGWIYTKKRKMIKVISAYRVSQATPAQAGELTSCKQQVHSMLRKEIKNPNPKKAFSY